MTREFVVQSHGKSFCMTASIFKWWINRLVATISLSDSLGFLFVRYVKDKVFVIPLLASTEKLLFLITEAVATEEEFGTNSFTD